ncbi:hypothetical protein GOODEAATRI_032177, partial [Goodea atripinnis]
RVVYIGQIPNIKYSDQDILKLAEPYGKIRKYFLHRLRREVQCFIEMEKAESAEKMAEACKGKQLKFNGKRLTIYVSRKYKQLKHGRRWTHRPIRTDRQKLHPLLMSTPTRRFSRPMTPTLQLHVKMGYYCRICFLFYSNEDKAKKTHCSSQAHYDKLQVRPGPAHCERFRILKVTRNDFLRIFLRLGWFLLSGSSVETKGLLP